MDENEHRDGLPIRLFEDRAALEDWLSTEPPTSKGAWLRFAKKGAGLASVSKSEAIDAALCHGWIDGQLDKYDDASWIVRFTPRKRASKWSAVNRQRALELIDAGRMAPAGLAEIEAAQADGRWAAAYAPASRAQVPADLQAALDRSPAAAEFFATLTGANRYAILYRIDAAKKSNTRARRIAEFVSMLERGETVHGSKKPT
ncbi:YdeI family protein [Sphingomonas sp.]|uniref:YdeI/OmpD-associated family protein n=1 Tax=Sphingomonas sp. TaxID=28214 RepID=UPI0025EA3C65|nr:YdeI/OmpD-associated family protein [Sphingomonas sp.]